MDHINHIPQIGQSVPRKDAFKKVNGIEYRGTPAGNLLPRLSRLAPEFCLSQGTGKVERGTVK